MMFPVIFQPGAEAELNDAIRWYDSQKQGIGRIFGRETQTTLTDYPPKMIMILVLHGTGHPAELRRLK